MKERKVIDAALFKLKLVEASRILKERDDTAAAIAYGAFQSAIELVDAFPAANKLLETWHQASERPPLYKKRRRGFNGEQIVYYESVPLFVMRVDPYAGFHRIDVATYVMDRRFCGWQNCGRDTLHVIYWMPPPRPLFDESTEK